MKRIATVLLIGLAAAQLTACSSSTDDTNLPWREYCALNNGIISALVYNNTDEVESFSSAYIDLLDKNGKTLATYRHDGFIVQPHLSVNFYDPVLNLSYLTDPNKIADCTVRVDL